MIWLASGSSMSGDLLQAHGSPAPHWQPSSWLQARSGWFSQTKPMPKHMGQLGLVMASKSARALLQRSQAYRAPRLRRQFFANRGGRIAYLVDGVLQLILRDTKLLGPILDLEVFIHVDLATIALVPLGEIVAHPPPPSPGQAAHRQERSAGH